MTASAKRKPRSRSERPSHLQLAPPPKPQRRRKLRLKMGRTRKPKFTKELLAYEEDIVFGAVVEMGGRVALDGMMDRWPGRFRRRELWWVLLRLASQRRLHTPPGLGAIGIVRRQSGNNIWDLPSYGRKTKAWFERYKPQSGREFWV